MNTTSQKTFKILKLYGGGCERFVKSTAFINLLERREGKSYTQDKLNLLIDALTSDCLIRADANSPNRKIFSVKKYWFLLLAPFDVGKGCCGVMKKAPMHKYSKDTGRHPMTAQMASESRLRMQKWILNGCNAYDLKEPISNPMSFWTEQDILLYCKINKLPICSVYGSIVDKDGNEIDLTEYVDKGTCDKDRPLLKTTGCDRTGCMFCGYGCHLEKPGESRFVRLKETHPKQYEYIMKPESEGGLNYKEIIDWLNENGNLHIEY